MSGIFHFSQMHSASVCSNLVRSETSSSTQHTEIAYKPFSVGSVVRILIVAIVAILTGIDMWEPHRFTSVIGITALAVGGWPIFKEALENLMQRRMTMELSMTIAIVAAIVINEVFTALIISLFVLVAEELERLTMARGRTAIANLLDFAPREATVRENGGTKVVPVDTLNPGDLVLVSPGEGIPVDGVVSGGHSHVDQSRITGESMPAEKRIGSFVYAGSINQAGVLEVQVERVGPDTSYGRIVHAVETAEQSRAPVQKLADKLAGYLVYVSFAAASITYLVTQDIRATISVIIVAGACGVAAGTPLAILGGVGQAAGLGSIVKGGLHLESLGRVDTVVFDKTGTLTLGEPVVQALLPADDVAEEELLHAAGCAEIRSEHPLAAAVMACIAQRGMKVLEPSRFEYRVGLGILAYDGPSLILAGNRKLLKSHGIDLHGIQALKASSEIFVARDGRYLGSIVVADPIREEAKSAIASMSRMGITTILLTGDVLPVAEAVSTALGISDYEAGLLPEEKQARIEGLTAEGRIVAMLGDGVNDAPALTRASVGVAMGGGTDVAKASAGVVLLGNDLAKFAETLGVASKTRSVIWQNFAGTLGVDCLGMGLAAFGFLNPLLAAFIHVSSEMVFILNSARLLPSARRFTHRPTSNAVGNVTDGHSPA